MILSFVGHKGGTGKSTVAISLAVELLERGRSVLLVDADRQRTVRQWVATAKARGHLLPQTTECDFEHVERASLVAWARDYEAVLIDCPSRSTDLQRRALSVSDLALIPSGTSMLDVWTLRNTVDVVTRARAERPSLETRFLVNRRVHGTTIARQARQDLTALGCEVMATELGHRVAYQQALGAGLGVTTFHPDGHAASEIRALADEIRNVLRAAESVVQATSAPWRFADFKAFTEYERKTVYVPLHTM